MTTRNMTQDLTLDDRLEDFMTRDITLDGVTKKVLIAGTGPAVIVMTEMPGISPQVARFARWVIEAGFTVYMPSLSGHAAGCRAHLRPCPSRPWLRFSASSLECPPTRRATARHCLRAGALVCLGQR